MANILIIQPRKMMQQAFAVVLGVDHRIQVLERFPEAAVVKDFDALIVDAAGLSENDHQALHNCNVPMVWIENGSTEAPSEHKKFAIIKLPIQRDLLMGAVAQCLGMANGRRSSKALVDLSVAGAPVKDVKTAAEPASALISATPPRVIELVDVVQEAQQYDECKTVNLEK